MIEIPGDRIVLRTMTREEYHDSRRHYIADPVMESEPYVYDKARVDAAYDRMETMTYTYPYFGIFLPERRIIGVLCLKRIDREKGRCEIGIALNTDEHKEKGYGTEAFALAVTYAFEELGLKAVYADTMGSNVRMQRILNRLGFRCFFRMKEAYDMRNRWEDRLDYVLTREAWEADDGAQPSAGRETPPC